MERFLQILYDLSQELHTDLYLDRNQVCQINYLDKLSIQLQYEDRKQRLLVAAFICDIPPGKYREKLLKEALKYNNIYPRVATLAYSERNNKLTLFAYLPDVHLLGPSLFQFIEKFRAEALEWKDAVEGGKTLPVKGFKKERGNSMFGLQP